MMTNPDHDHPINYLFNNTDSQKGQNAHMLGFCLVADPGGGRGLGGLNPSPVRKKASPNLGVSL